MILALGRAFGLQALCGARLGDSHLHLQLRCKRRCKCRLRSE
jgi:hypothetical protein